MAPSRGTPLTKNHDDGEAAIEQQSNTALLNAKRNLNYLWSPQSSTDRPARLRTRALLRFVRSISQFVIWRLVRWAKYAAMGAIVAAIGATAVGSVVSGVAWIAAPTTIGGSVVAACIWGVGRYSARKLNERWKATGGDEGEAERELQNDHSVKGEGTFGQEMGPRAMPW